MLDAQIVGESKYVGLISFLWYDDNTIKTMWHDRFRLDSQFQIIDILVI